ncbi:uncharacterized protein LOC135473672 [Liolophura sinensis]|uniref:uncharacterized protein LOC135473672 n=1 Tax=Liolophura sinensis TaxID=3198878 RepID=UPI003159426D
MNNYQYNPGSDSNPRLRASQAREQDRLEKRLSAYEREYKIRASSIAARQKQLQESLLAHSIRLRSTVQQGRVGEHHDRAESEELIVRAKPIRRFKGRGDRKILTLQELLSRGPNTRVAPMAIPPESATHAFPHADHHPTSKHSRADYLKLNLVSASDLNDFGDLPEFGKSSPALPQKPQMPLSHVQKQDVADEIQTAPRNLPPLQNKSDVYQQLTENATKDFYVFISSDDDISETGSKIPQRKLEPLNNIRKRRISARNSRMKRMKLPTTTLDLIPEDDPADGGSPDIEVSGRQLNFKVLSASKGNSLLRNTALEPLDNYTVRNIIGQYGASLNPIRTLHRKRENDRKVGVEMEIVVPRKRSYKSSDDIETNGARPTAPEEVKPACGDSIRSRRTRRRDGYKSTPKTGYGRLVFLQDSPNRSQ